MYKHVVKRMLDIVISLIVLIVLSPLYLVLIALVRVNLGSPVFFHQDRPGKNEKIFRLYKFRSMNDKRDADGNLLPDEVRLTTFGKLLRKSSLDELPEFYNILKGDMSFIGPRPLLVSYLPYYTARERHRHDVRPGLTGLAQVNGRNALMWEERFKYDLYYVKHCSFALDTKILQMTVKKVFQSEGIRSGAEQNVPDFDKYRQEMDQRNSSNHTEGQEG
ncbi:MAG: sugar transferase [Lachnospiraceae bacterium]|nr:sugar transferase [Lachnospiraceae bacterium]